VLVNQVEEMEGQHEETCGKRTGDEGGAVYDNDGREKTYGELPLCLILPGGRRNSITHYLHRACSFIVWCQRSVLR
jgi:hypothetical protein